MLDKEKLNKVDMTLRITERKVNSKSKYSRFTEEEKQEILNGLTRCAEDLAFLLNDESVEESIKSQLAKNTRKQLYNLKKVLEEEIFINAILTNYSKNENVDKN